MSDETKDSFFSNLDEDRAKDTESFIAHMKAPREEVEAPDFEIPGLDEEDEVPTEGKPAADEDGLMLEYSSEQLWSAELLLWKVDEVIAWLLSIYSGQSPDKYRKRKGAASSSDDREVQLFAAILNKYQMKMSLEWAFISLFAMSYAPVVMQATTDAKKKRKAGEAPPTPQQKEKEVKQ